MLKKALIIFIWIAVIAALVAYLVRHAGDLANVLKVSPLYITLIVILFIATQYLNALRTDMLLEKIGVKLGMRECFHLSNLNSMANYLPFKGGTLATAVYFRNKHNVSYANYANILIANQIFLFLTIGLVSCCLIVISYLATGVFLAKLFYFFGLLFVSMLPIFIFLKTLAKKERFFGMKLKKIKPVILGSSMILGDAALLSKLFVVNLFSMLAIGLRFSVAFRIVSYKASFVLSVLAGQVKTLAMLLNITPSGLGLAEFSAGIVSSITNRNLNIGVYAASVDRIISVVVLLVISIVAFIYLYRRKRNIVS